MLIKCPYCFLEKEISAIQPGRKYKITCPRCATVFRVPPEAPQENNGNDISDSPLSENLQGNIGKEPIPVSSQEINLHEKEENKNSSDLEIPALPESASGEIKQKNSLTALFNRLKNDDHTQDDSNNDNTEQGKIETPAGAPWEHPEYYGLAGGFLYTFTASIVHPCTFFKNLVGGLPHIRPIIYYIMLTLVQAFFTYLWSMINLSKLSSTSTDQNIISMSENMLNTINLPMVLLITPFLAVFLIFILSGFYYLMVRLVQAENADFSIVLRVLCYSSSIFIFYIVPTIGAYIATFGYKILIFIGCKYALNLSWKNTVFAILPIFFLELILKAQLLSFFAGL